MAKDGKIKAGDLIAQLNSDPIHQSRMREREAQDQQKLAQLRVEERQLTDDLRAVGIDVASVWDLVNRREPYPKAIPVLADHLARPYSDTVMEGIARALTVREAQGIAGAALLDAFVKMPTNGTSQTKWVVGNALAMAATESILPRLMQVVQDRAHGSDRMMLVYALAVFRKKYPAVVPILKALRSDSDLGADAKRALEGKGPDSPDG